MPRIAHIQNGQIVNVSVGPEGWTAPGDGSQVLEADAIAAGIPRWTPPVERPDAPAWKVKVWFVRQNIDLATIPAIIESQIPAGPEREEALIRWTHAPTVPFDHPLVALIANELELDPADVWDEIHAV
ncbi:hypothetical protein EBZ39_18155 [bacterium]|nr:hypothetical protein [bacterium]